MLDFQLARIVFKGGLDLADPFLISPKNLTVLQDAVFDDAETIIQRPGYNAVPTEDSITHNPALGTPIRMSRNGSAPLLESSAGLHTMNPAGYSTPVMSQQARQVSFPSNNPVFTRATAEQSQIATITDTGAGWLPVLGTQEYDCASASGWTVFAWQETAPDGVNNQIHVRVYDEVTRVVVGESIQFLAGNSFECPRVVAGKSNGQIVVLCSNSATFVISYLAIDVTNHVIGVPWAALPVTVANISRQFDAIMSASDNQQLVVTYRTGALQNRTVRFNTAISAEAGAALFAVAAAPNALSLVEFRNTVTARTTYCSLYTTAAGLRGHWLDFVGGVQAEVNIRNTATSMARCTGIEIDSANSTFRVFVDEHDTGAYLTPPGDDTKIVDLEVNKNALTVASTTVTNGGVLIASRPALINGAVYLSTYYPSSIDPSVFVMRYEGAGLSQYAQVVARLAQGEAGNFRDLWQKSWRVASLIPLAGSTGFAVPLMRWGSYTSTVGSTIATPSQLWRADIDVLTQSLNYAEVNGLTVLAGACPHIFDGDAFFEAGFNHVPQITNGVLGGAGGLGIGTYRFVATFSCRDARGNWHESGPSNILTLSPGGVSGYTLTVRTLRLTNRSNVKINIYRTVANGSVFYRDTGVANAFSAGLSDASLIAGTVLTLQSQGGDLTRAPLPTCRYVAEHQDRLFFCGGEDGYDIFFTHRRSDSSAPEFSTLLRRRVPASWGRVVGIASIDEKLVIVCERRVGFLYGEGPTRTGAQDNYSQPVEAVSGYGARWDSPGSIIRSDEGVWFQSLRGIRLITRQFSLAKSEDGNDFGSEVDNFIGQTKVLRALANATKQQFRFYCADGTVYVYDTLWSQWSKFTNHACTDAIVAGDSFYHYSGTSLFVAADTARSDNGTIITGVFETSWLNFAGLMGFQRVTHLQALGQLNGANVADAGLTTTWEAYYDYDLAGSSVQSLGAVTYTAGSTQPRFETEIQLPKQKCQALKLRVTFANQNAADQARFRLTALSLRVGLKKGRAKLATADRH